MVRKMISWMRYEKEVSPWCLAIFWDGYLNFCWRLNAGIFFNSFLWRCTWIFSGLNRIMTWFFVFEAFVWYLCAKIVDNPTLLAYTELFWAKKMADNPTRGLKYFWARKVFQKFSFLVMRKKGNSFLARRKWEIIMVEDHHSKWILLERTIILAECKLLISLSVLKYSLTMRKMIKIWSSPLWIKNPKYPILILDFWFEHLGRLVKGSPKHVALICGIIYEFKWKECKGW